MDAARFVRNSALLVVFNSMDLLTTGLLLLEISLRMKLGRFALAVASGAGEIVRFCNRICEKQINEIRRLRELI